MARTEKQTNKRKRRKLLARKGYTPYQKPSVSPKEVTDALNLFQPADRPLYRGPGSWMKTAEPSQGELFPEDDAR